MDTYDDPRNRHPGSPARGWRHRRRPDESGTDDELDLIPVGVAHFDRSGRFTRVNDRLCDLLGCDEETLLTRRYQEISMPEEVARCEALNEQLAAGRIPRYAYEKRFIRPDGSVVWARVTVSAVRRGSGEVSHFVGVAEDLTEQRAREAARREAEERAEREQEGLLERERRARAEAERAIRTRDDVLAVVAHDLRNPLNTILMTASLIHEALGRGDPRDRYLALIRRAATDMDTLVRDLLDISRMEAGTFALDRAPVDLGALLRDCLELFEPQARPRRIALTLHIEPPLPSVIGDAARLRQVVSNLVGNALRFTPDAGRIGVRALPRGDQVHVAVRDTGPGIEPEDQQHLFDRFWKRDARAGAGAGLGLAIVRGIVRAHGGQVWVRSTPGAGTTFYFTLPRGAG